MKSFKRIPIKAAKDIADKYNQNEVILVTFDAMTGLTHVVTYGKTLFDCQSAAVGGNRLKREFLKWPDELCHDVPARMKKGN